MMYDKLWPDQSRLKTGFPDLSRIRSGRSVLHIKRSVFEREISLNLCVNTQKPFFLPSINHFLIFWFLNFVARFDRQGIFSQKILMLCEFFFLHFLHLIFSIIFCQKITSWSNRTRTGRSGIFRSTGDRTTGDRVLKNAGT